MTLGKRFENILANKNLSERDREFITSVKKYYDKNGKISSGQARWFGKLEERYAKLVTGAKMGCPTITKRLEALAKVVKPSTWDAGFVESVTKQNNTGRKLSDKQLETIAKIEDRNSVKNQAARSEWFNNYDEYHREIAKVCAEYYSNSHYYQDLSKKILSNPDFIPTQKQWESMCQNKYALKVIKNHESEPKFDSQSVVEIRKSSDTRKFNRTRLGKPGFIIQTNVRAPDPCAGGRWYSVLFAGETTPVLLREKDIKTMKMAKL